MSQHRSLRAAATLGGKRNVLKRFERIEVVGEPERGVSNFILGITKLPVRIAA